ncbi:MAG: FAD:protein FMN transferase [Planctomycetota bacterium]
MKKAIIVIILVLSGLVAGWLNAFYKQTEPVARSSFLMNTYCTIKIPGKPEVVEPVIAKGFKRMAEISRKFNAFDQTSPVYQFNHNNVPITDPEIIDLIKIAQEVGRQSGGAFDLTVEPLVRRWGIYSDPAKAGPTQQTGFEIPSPSDIQSALTLVGNKHLSIQDGKVTKDTAGVRIDFGGIAKGYAIQETVKIFKNEGIPSALIEMGGQVYAFGKINNRSWQIGIRNPRQPDGIFMELLIDDDGTSVSTSGDYERFFERDGQRYHHIFNPKTGQPARGVISLSVIMSDPVLADAWSTAFFVMGPEETLKLARKKPELEVIIITETGEIICSPKIIKYTGQKNYPRKLE